MTKPRPGYRHVLAMALVGLAVAGAEPGTADHTTESTSEDQVYDYTCGHLGTPCESDPAEPRKPRTKNERGKRGCARKADRRGRRSHRD